MVMPLPRVAGFIRFSGSPTKVLLLFYRIVIFYCIVCAFCFSKSQMIENNVQGTQTWSYGNKRQSVRKTVPVSYFPRKPKCRETLGPDTRIRTWHFSEWFWQGLSLRTLFWLCWLRRGLLFMSPSDLHSWKDHKTLRIGYVEHRAIQEMKAARKCA